MKKKLNLILFLFLLLIFSNLSKAIEPDVFVQSTVNRASQTLSKNISKEEKMLELQETNLKPNIYMLSSR